MTTSSAPEDPAQTTGGGGDTYDHGQGDGHALELTRSALREGLPTLGLEGGLVEVERWVGRTREAGLPQVADALEELRGLLTSASTEAAAWRDVLTRLSEQTHAASEGATDERIKQELHDLAHELQQAPGSLGGAGGTSSGVTTGH